MKNEKNANSRISTRVTLWKASKNKNVKWTAYVVRRIFFLALSLLGFHVVVITSVRIFFCLFNRIFVRPTHPLMFDSLFASHFLFLFHWFRLLCHRVLLFTCFSSSFSLFQILCSLFSFLILFYSFPFSVCIFIHFYICNESFFHYIAFVACVRLRKVKREQSKRKKSNNNTTRNTKCCFFTTFSRFWNTLSENRA